VRYIFVLYFTFVQTCIFHAQKKTKLDSLLAQENNFKKDTVSIKNYLVIASKLKKRNLDSSMLYANKALKLATELKDDYFFIRARHEKCLLIKSLGNFKQSSDSLLEVYNDSRLSKYPSSHMRVCLDLGVNYRYLANFDKSIKFLLEALSIAKRNNNKTGIYNSYNSLANTYSQVGVIKKNKTDLERALENYQEALKYIDSTNVSLKGMVLNNQGVTYFNIGQIIKDTLATLRSIPLYKQSLEYRRISNDSVGIANLYNNIGSSYHDLYVVSKKTAYLSQSSYNYEKSIEIAKLINLPEIYTFYINYAGNLSMEGEETKNKEVLQKALKLFSSAHLISKENNDNYNTLLCTEGLAKTYHALKMNDSSVVYYMKYVELKDTILNAENKQIAEDLAMKYESDLKDTENNNLKDQAELREDVISRKSTQINLMIAGSTLLITLIVLVFISRQKINKAKIESEKQKKIIEEKNKEIIDSINYAKRLQDAAIPSQEYFRSLLPHSFIYYKPKDIVAGDFYWIHQLKGKNKLLVAAADCTGHGVPGALVSIVCLNALNRCVEEFGLTDPSKILDKTTEIIQQSFRLGENDVKDGMDIGLALLDIEKNEGIFSGANNPLWILSNGMLKEIKGDSQPVGKQHKPKPFTQHEFKFKKDDLVVLFTDGYADQFGGPNGKKLKSKVFKEQIAIYSTENISYVRKNVEDIFVKWKGSHEQVDDVLVVGIKI